MQKKSPKKVVKNAEIDLELLTFSKYIEGSKTNYWTPSGLYILDKLIGRGIPGGKIIEIYGPPSSAKTTIAQRIAAAFQKQGYIAVYLDVDATLDALWAKIQGINCEELIYTIPNTLEECFNLIEQYLDILGKKYPETRIVIILDTIVCPTEEDLKADLTDTDWGKFAKQVTKGIKKLHPKIKNSAVTLIILNEVREVMGSYMHEEKPVGGLHLKHADVMRIKCKIKEKVFDEDTKEPLGLNFEIYVDKNKAGVPWRSHVFYLDFKTGIDDIKSILDYAVQRRIIKVKGAWYIYEDINLGQGINKAKQYLEENLNITDNIKKDIDKYLGLGETANELL